jgi:hypothetical protein
MAIFSLADFSSFINHQIKAQEQMGFYLWRLEALIAVAIMAGDFYDLPKNILHNYLSMASDLIEEAVKTNQLSLSELLKQED